MRILLPIDTSDCSDAAMQTVIRQFRPDQTEVRVMHAVEWPKELPTYLAFAEGPSAARDILDARSDQMDDGRALVSRTAEQLKSAGFATSMDVRDGNATDMILESAADWRPDVIVIGSHGRKGIGRLLLGSVAEHVMRHAPCAVEVVRPAPQTALGVAHVHDGHAVRS
jgi:nucleotide-binding universal stress UspA family protein